MMKLLDKWNMSRWAYEQCRNGNNIEEIKSLITDSFWAYWYCNDIKDEESIRNQITNPLYAYAYCLYIKDRPEIRKYVIDKDDLDMLRLKRKNETIR